MNLLDSPKPRFSVSVDADLYDKITTYQHGKKIKSQTQAIAEILKIGINSILEEDGITPPEPDPPIPPQLARIIEIYDSMNSEGQYELAKQARLLSLAPEYKKGYSSVSSKSVG